MVSIKQVFSNQTHTFHNSPVLLVVSCSLVPGLFGPLVLLVPWTKRVFWFLGALDFDPLAIGDRFLALFRRAMFSGFEFFQHACFSLGKLCCCGFLRFFLASGGFCGFGFPSSASRVPPTASPRFWLFGFLGASCFLHCCPYLFSHQGSSPSPHFFTGPLFSSLVQV